ncbi:pyruvoyl-dependent arginine decarboxylase [Amycolatopsis sp. cg5]|uniref:pyruvoyl-dependent arginine decarboxylase n=1 Tax=Amycolatopsis sp. cg5 TaxID=3238802 RepID=UPI003524947D
MWFNTRAVVLTAGVGTGSSEIVAFDAALRAAAIADFNLIRVTSIVPPTVPVLHIPPPRRTEPIDGQGQMLPTVYAVRATNRTGQQVSAAVGVGVSDLPDRSGVIFINEQTDGTADNCVRDLELMIMEGMRKLRRTDTYAFHHAAATATADTTDEAWTCTMAACCFVDDDLMPYFADRAIPVD